MRSRDIRMLFWDDSSVPVQLIGRRLIWCTPLTVLNNTSRILPVLIHCWGYWHGLRPAITLASLRGAMPRVLGIGASAVVGGKRYGRLAVGVCCSR